MNNDAEQPRRLRDCFWIVAVWAIPIVLLRPFQNTPYVDDWVYAWSVEHLLRTGELRILDISSSANPAQVLWGALFCVPGGFSFAALRVSTWVLSALGLCGLYLLLRELDVGRRDALFVTACLGFYPVYFILSYTFMTDVPFLSALLWFSYAAVRLLRTAQVRWLALATVLASVAIAIRPLGAVLPVALTLTLLQRRQTRLTHRWYVLPLLVVSVTFTGVLLWWYSAHTERRADLTWIEGSPAWRISQMQYAVDYFPMYIVDNWLFCTSALGIALAPVAASRFSKDDLRRIVIACAICGGVFVVRPLVKASIYVPLHHGETWSLMELGGLGIRDAHPAALPPWYRNSRLR